MRSSVVVIGGGLVGMAAARQIRERFPRARITLLEKEAAPGRHQSTHNSGVLHAGLYYAPGSAKARLAVRGLRLMVAFCERHSIPHEICGKLVVATSEPERRRLDTLFERGTANGLAGLRLLSRSEMLEMEPHAGGIAAIHVPEEGIVDYRAVCAALHRDLGEHDCDVVTGARASRIRKVAAEWRIRCADGREFPCDYLVNCGGLHCDRIARQAGERPKLRIVPFRGEYYQLRPEACGLVRHLIYPVPDPAFPFLGVHFTRLISGGIEAGPNAVLAFAREGYRYRDVNIRDLLGSLSFPGLWSFLRRYPGMVSSELAQSLSLERFARNLQKLVPEIRPEHLAPGGAGVRAQAMQPDGTLEQDFAFARAERALHVLNAPSPAATASLGIGEEIAATIAL